MTAWDVPAGHGSAASRREIADATTGRHGAGPADVFEARLWPLLQGQLTSAGMRWLRDTGMDKIREAFETCARDQRRVAEW